MFDELKRTIEDSSVSSEAKVAISILVKSLGWMPWVFFLIGLFLSTQYFVLWLIFFMVVEGGLFLALIYVLTVIVKASVGPPQRPPRDPQSAEAERSSRGLLRRALDGVVGNFAFYLVILGGLVLVKLTGIADAALDAIAHALGQ